MAYELSFDEEFGNILNVNNCQRRSLRSNHYLFDHVRLETASSQLTSQYLTTSKMKLLVTPVIIFMALIPFQNANVLRIFQEEPPVPRYQYTPQFLQHTEAGKRYYEFSFASFIRFNSHLVC